MTLHAVFLVFTVGHVVERLIQSVEVKAALDWINHNTYPLDSSIGFGAANAMDQ